MQQNNRLTAEDMDYVMKEIDDVLARTKCEEILSRKHPLVQRCAMLALRIDNMFAADSNVPLHDADEFADGDFDLEMEEQLEPLPSPKVEKLQPETALQPDPALSDGVAALVRVRCCTHSLLCCDALIENMLITYLFFFLSLSVLTTLSESTRCCKSCESRV